MNALLDGDIFCWRAAAASEGEDLFVAAERLDYMINMCLDEVGAKEQVLFLSGKGNFRYNVYPEYKAQRAGKPRPKWEQALKNHMVDHWEALIVNGIEADDALGIAQYAAQKESTIICTIDKDLDQIEGWHYNFVKKEKYYVTDEEAIHFFFTQLLTGDPVDNIKGVVGIGKAKAAKLLDNLETVKDMYETVKDCYSNEDEMDMNAKCLWIWRKQNDYWKEWIDTSSSES